MSWNLPCSTRPSQKLWGRYIRFFICNSVLIVSTWSIKLKVIFKKSIIENINFQLEKQGSIILDHTKVKRVLLWVRHTTSYMMGQVFSPFNKHGITRSRMFAKIGRTIIVYHFSISSSMKRKKCYYIILKVLATNSEFLIPISLESNVLGLKLFQTMNSELKTLEWWISRSMLDLLFF